MNTVSETSTERSERCHHGHHHHERHHHQEPEEVKVVYNGLEKTFHFGPAELVRKLLDQAIKEFHITQNPHMQALFNQQGTELSDSETLEAAGVKCGDTLLLRASTVRAGQ